LQEVVGTVGAVGVRPTNHHTGGPSTLTQRANIGEPDRRGVEPFRHEALLYGGIDGFIEATVPFLRAGADGGDAMLVVVDAAKIDALREILGADAPSVTFADMAEVGANPARIIPAWRAFVDAHPERRLRGIGEPIWSARSSAELVECERHEALLNVVFAGGGLLAAVPL
jgi:hypothetical protein